LVTQRAYPDWKTKRKEEDYAQGRITSSCKKKGFNPKNRKDRMGCRSRLGTTANERFADRLSRSVGQTELETECGGDRREPSAPLLWGGKSETLIKEMKKRV